MPRREISSSGIVRRAFLAAMLGLACLAGACALKISDKSVLRTDTEDVAQRLKDEKDGKVLLIDARAPQAFSEATLPGAVNLRLGQISEDKRIPVLERYGTLIIFGQNPGSAPAMAMAKRLLTARYSDVLLFEGGVDAWRAASLPVFPGRATVPGMGAGSPTP